jgi:cytochrome c peroxidase
MASTSKPTLWLLLLALTGCGKLADELFCESEGCDWKAGEWARVAALANPGAPPPDPSNEYLGDSAAELLGQAFFFDKAFSGLPTEVDAINRPSPPARTPKCQPLAISCATCHDLARAGVDTTSVPGHVSVGAGWTDVNALAVVNSAYRPLVFWNGRADSLWALNVVVAESPTTLNGNRLRTAHQIADRYARFYDDVFAKRFLPLDIAAINRLPANGKPRTADYDNLTCDDPGVTCDDKPEIKPEDERRKPKAMVTRILVNWAKAIAAYEYRLNSRDSDFDKFVAEGPGSGLISAAAQRGARLFVGKAACVDCHFGPQLTDDQFHNIGVPQAGVTVPLLGDCPAGNAPCDCSSTATGLRCAPWGGYDGLRRLRDTTPGSPTENRWLRTGGWSGQPDHSRDSYLQRPLTPDLKGAWRTPSLRNVALTAPYMHDGRYATLEDVIWHYNTGGQTAGGEVVNPAGVAAQIKPLLLTDAEVGDLVAFLETLTDQALPDYLRVAPQDVGLPTGIGGAPGSCATGAGGTGGSGGIGGSGGATGMGGAAGMGGSVTGLGGAGGGTSGLAGRGASPP